MAKFKLLAVRWDQPTKTGFKIHRQGAVIELTAQEAKRLLKCGAIEAHTVRNTRPKPTKPEIPDPTPEEDTSDPVVEDQDPEEPAPADEDGGEEADQDQDEDTSVSPELPRPSATTDEWRQFAIEDGHPEEEINEMTRKDIRALYES